VGDGCGGITHGHGLCKPFRFFASTSITEELVDVDEAGAGENALVANAPKLADQVAQELDFQIVACTEVRVSPFTSKDLVLTAIPKHSCLPEAGAGGNHRAISRRVSGADIQRDNVICLQRTDAPGHGFQIIDQER
jgi:hypothetical protein